MTQGSVHRLRLRPFRAEDEAPSLAAHRILKEEGFDFLLDLQRVDEPWASYLDRIEQQRRGVGLHERWVASTFLAATVDDELVGRASIRHRLNDWLARYGGHVGYAVLSQHRRRGYATEILRQSVVIARSVGIDDVLVTCDVRNVASAGVIEACGGEFESVIDGPGEGEQRRRYWIR